MRLISVVREELMIGQPLRWALYDQERNVLLDRGAVIANAAQLKSVLEVNPLREPTPNASHADANAAEEPGKTAGKTFTFPDMKLRVNDRIQLQLPASMGGDRHAVKMIGYLEGASILVTPPAVNGMYLPMRAGDKIIARVFTSQTAFAFDSTIERVCKIPYDYLHLFYPAAVQGAVVRQAPRIKTKIIASVTKSGAGEPDDKLSGIIVNVSAQGALVCMRQPLDKKSQHITLSFRINLHDVDTHLSIKAIIRNVQTDDTKENTDPLKYQHGVQFLGMQPTDNMILQSLIYQQMVEQPQNLI